MLSTSADLTLLDSLLDQAETAAYASGGRSNIPTWVIANTRHPKQHHRPWSFKGHEFQIQLLEDQAPHIVVQKAAQKGISELMVRLILALLAKLSGEHAIYVLPTVFFARKFTSSRFDPVIKASPRLASLISKATDSTEIKQIGSCFLHIGGAQKESQAISIPARILVRDEYSFGDPEVLSVYQSRLEHNPPHERIIYDFSTPLYPKSGISELYEQGTQYVYLCYHTRCGNWTVVDSLKQLILPGFDKDLTELTKDDLRLNHVKVDEAWLQCTHCRAPISQENLADPLYRAWVPYFPDREIHSYHIDPLCTATITTPAQVINSLNSYGKVSKWVQYGLGQPFESADSQIIESAKNRAFQIRPVPPTGNTSVYNAVAGMDVGKISYLTNGKMTNGVLEVFNMEMLRQDSDNELGEAFLDRFRAYRSVRGVIDMAPDLTIVKYVQGRTQYNAVWGAYFTRSARSANLETFIADELEGVVKVNRTQTLDDFVKAFNKGKVLLPKGLEYEEEIKEHLSRPKRIADEDAIGEEQVKWVSKGADHWFFSLAYLWLAAQMAEVDGIVVPAGLGGTLVSKVRLKRGP